MNDRAKKLIEKMDKERGFNVPWRNILAELDPDFMDGIHKQNMQAIYRKDGLPIKYIELLMCIIDVVTGYESGFPIHVRKAFEEGLTEIEMIQALEICSMSGSHYISRFIATVDQIAKSCENEKKQVKKKK